MGSAHNFVCVNHSETVQLYSLIVVTLLFVGSVVLCVTLLNKPPYYLRRMNIVSCALQFGVCWTNAWSYFVVLSRKMVVKGVLTQSTADVVKATVHLALMPMFMMVGALCMARRVESPVSGTQTAGDL